MDVQSGQCLCGHVSFTLNNVEKEFNICHCTMCRRWIGGPNLSFMAQPGDINWKGEENISIYPSSAWAERGFCQNCGSALFYRIVMDGPAKGELHMPIGLLNDLSEFSLKYEIYYDFKPDIYAFAGESEKLTEAQVLAMYNVDN